MQLKKWFVSLLAVVVASVSFALPATLEENSPAADAMQQYAAQMEELNRTFDQTVLPPLKGMITVVKEFGESGAEDLTPTQEKQLETYRDQLSAALEVIVNPIVEQVDVNEFNQQMKQMLASLGQPTDQEFTKQDLSDQLMPMMVITSLDHFAQTGKLSQEEVEIALLLFLPEEELVQ